MGRWTQYDEDDYRLPEGMKRVGYDADTQKYTFKDRDGDLYEGPEGSEFGELTKVSSSGGGHIDPAIPRRDSSSSDLEASVQRREDGYELVHDGEGGLHQLQAAASPREAYKTLLPFLLIVLVVLLLVARLVVSPSMLGHGPWQCPEHSRSYKVKSGESCWAISQDYGVTLEQLRAANPSLDCAKLDVGQKICVPVHD